MHLSLFYTSYFAFQGRRTASDFSTASMLSHWFPISLELFWHEADYTSTASRSLWPRLFLSPPLAHTRSPRILLFALACFVDMHLFSVSIFDLFFPFSCFGMQNVCVRVYVREGETERVHIMNNAWCGFLVSETDRRWGRWTAPRVLFFPPHTVVKQTTSAEGSPISTLLLLYSHRQDLSPSIHNSATSWTAWPPIPEILNTFYHHMVANPSEAVTNSYKCVFGGGMIRPRWGFQWIQLSNNNKTVPHLQIKIFEIVNHVAQLLVSHPPSDNHRCALISAFNFILIMATQFIKLLSLLQHGQVQEPSHRNSISYCKIQHYNKRALAYNCCSPDVRKRVTLVQANKAFFSENFFFLPHWSWIILQL